MKPPFDEDEIRGLFQEVKAPPGVGRWRHPTVATEPEPVYIPPSHRERQPPVRRRRRTGLAVAASAFAVAALVGAVPVVVNAMTSPSAPAATRSARPSALDSSASPSPVDSASPSAPALEQGQTRTPGGTASAPAAQPPGWPDATTTGVPAGKALRTHDGDLVITTAGTVIDGLLVTGSIIVQAPDVTIRNTRVAPPHTAYWLIRQTPGATNLDVENTELVGNGVHIGVNMEAPGLRVQACDIHDVDTAVAVAGDSATVRSNYLHAVKTGVGAVGHHATLLIQQNTIVATIPGEAAISFADNNSLTNVVIDGNKLTGGNYTIYAGAGSGQQQISVRHNRFTRAASPKGGRYGPLAAWDATLPGDEWLDNVWDDTGTPVTTN
jgi:hypothetical protein